MSRGPASIYWIAPAAIVGAVLLVHLAARWL